MPKTTISTTYTKDFIRHKIEMDDRWMERAILAIFYLQEPIEKAAGMTTNENNVGFSQAHAPFLSYCANWLISGRHLTGNFKTKARRFILHYTGQLTKIANGELSYT